VLTAVEWKVIRRDDFVVYTGMTRFQINSTSKGDDDDDKFDEGVQMLEKYMPKEEYKARVQTADAVEQLKQGKRWTDGKDSKAGEV
jgi:hypothetical protein